MESDKSTLYFNRMKLGIESVDSIIVDIHLISIMFNKPIKRKYSFSNWQSLTKETNRRI